MFEVTVLSGEEFSGVSKSSGKPYTGFQFWYTVQGEPYSFKYTTFNADQIAKAKAAVEARKAHFRFVPDRNVQAMLILA